MGRVLVIIRWLVWEWRLNLCVFFFFSCLIFCICFLLVVGLGCGGSLNKGGFGVGYEYGCYGGYLIDVIGDENVKLEFVVDNVSCWMVIYV